MTASESARSIGSIPASIRASPTADGNFVLWHPDRKFFLLGKRIAPEWLADLEAPRE